MVADIAIAVKVSPAVQRKLDQGMTLSTQLPDIMKDGVLYVQSQIPGYPTAPSESRYVRTDTLGRSVTSLQGQADGALARVEPLGNHSVGYIGTNIVYAPYVIGEGTQAAVHQGRWYTLQSVVRGAIPGVVKIIRDGVIKHLGL